jgi:hypothetical protein
MKKFKYFIHGCATATEEPLYALYEPVLDCFLHLTTSLKLANLLKKILSSRYDLHVCCINNAVNYKLNLLDNLVCQNWTIDNRNNIVIANDPMYPAGIISVTKLLEKTNKTSSWDIDKEKQWIFICSNWIRFLEELKNSIHYQTDTILNKFLNLTVKSDKLDLINSLENQIMKVLYLDRDIEVDQNIIKLVESDSDVAEAWEFFSSINNNV